MLRTTLAAVAAMFAIGLIGAPVAGAAPCSGTVQSAACSTGGGANKPPDVRKSPRAVAAHRVADRITKRITDKIRRHCD